MYTPILVDIKKLFSYSYLIYPLQKCKKCKCSMRHCIRKATAPPQPPFKYDAENTPGKGYYEHQYENSWICWIGIYSTYINCAVLPLKKAPWRILHVCCTAVCPHFPLLRMKTWRRSLFFWTWNVGQLSRIKNLNIFLWSLYPNKTK